MKVVINAQFGGFSISKAALLCLRGLGLQQAIDEKLYEEQPDDKMIQLLAGLGESYGRQIPRDNALLVRVVEDLREHASGSHATLKVVEIPDGIDWEIDEYDGFEKVVEKHRSWA